MLEDGPLDPEFWLGQIDARLVGLFRAVLGALLLADALLTIPHLDAYYGSRGVWPIAQATGPLASLSDGGLKVAWLLGCLALAAFAAGIFSRVSATLVFVFLVGVHQRNEGLATGGDYLAQILVFLCVWADSGAAFSLDAKWRGKGRAFVPAGAWRAMQLHVAVLYFVTARLKIRGEWLTGDGVYMSLQQLGFLRPPGVLLLQHPELCRVMNWVVLALEGAFAFFAFSPIKGPRARAVALACALGVQLGILATMRVGVFTLVMLGCSLLFLPGRPAPKENIKNAPLERWLVTAGPLLCVILMAWGAFVGRRLPLPGVVNRSLERVGLYQPFNLFGNAFEVAQWHALGIESSGRTVDVLERAAPGFRSEVRWSYSPLYKLTFSERLQPAVVAQWLCRHYREQSSLALGSVELWKDARPPTRSRGGGEVPFKKVVLYSGPCQN
jgi:hypothetical protein